MVIKTPTGIREVLHAGVIGEARDDEVVQTRRAETDGNALERRLEAPHDPDAGHDLLDSLGL